jgi:hypothetical protein
MSQSNSASLVKNVVLVHVSSNAYGTPSGQGRGQILTKRVIAAATTPLLGR